MNRVEGRKLSIALGGRPVLRNVDFTLRAGELVGLIGPNGSGKTTLLRALCGLQSTDSGEVLLDGQPIAALSPSARARIVGYLPQRAVFHWPLTVAEAVALGRYAQGARMLGLSPENESAITAALAATSLTSMRERRVDELSGGEAMRVHLARLLAGGHGALVADEPVTSLDPRFQLELLELFRRQSDGGAAVVLSLHDLSLAFRTCDRIVVMHGGSIALSGKPSEIVRDPQLETVFGVAIEPTGPAAELNVVTRRR